jgi:hypothetical protein
MSRAPPITLTAEQESYLRAEHAKGTTFPLIATAMGMTCASLARRIRRLGLPKRERSPATAKPPVRRRPPSPARAVTAPSPRRPPRPGGIPLVDLAQNECRWPTGDWPPYLFCGEPVAAPGISWCAEHVRRVYNQPRRS